MNPCKRAIILSSAVAIIMCIGKSIAYVLTGSVAVLSDAAESVVHLITTAISAFSFYYAERPPDEDHPYGHEKIVYFSAAVEGAVIFSTAIGICWLALQSLWQGSEMSDLGPGLTIIALLAAVNAVLGKHLLKTGKEHCHIVLQANGQHLLSDMWTSIAVVLGVTTAKITGLTWLDPIIGMAIAVHILWASLTLLGTSFNGLMEKCRPETQTRIENILNATIEKEWIRNYHLLKHRYVNNRIWIDVHLEFPQDISLKDAHTKASLVEMHLKEHFQKEKVWITTHLEPEGHASVHPKGHFEFT